MYMCEIAVRVLYKHVQYVSATTHDVNVILLMPIKPAQWCVCMC